MTEWFAERFEENRAHLSRVAYRMLGSLDDAEDAVQEAWLRFSRSENSGIENIGGVAHYGERANLSGHAALTSLETGRAPRAEHSGFHREPRRRPRS